MFKASMCLTAIVVGLCLPAFAQIPTAHDFARHSEVYEVALSPDGKHVAMTLPTQDNRETQLLIAPLDGNGKTQRMRFGNQEHVSDIVWTADDRVTLARARNMPLQPMPYSLGQLFSTDVTGKDQETLFGYFQNKGLATARRKDEGFASRAEEGSDSGAKKPPQVDAAFSGEGYHSRRDGEGALELVRSQGGSG